jgi:hypothetical protein
MSWAEPSPPAFDGERDAESLAAAEVARANNRIAYLDEIAELAMELARAQQKKALAQIEAPPEEAGEARERDAATGFINAARAVRVTLLLQAKLQAGLNVRRVELGEARRARKLSEGIERAQENSAKSDALAEIVADVVETEAGDRPDVERLTERARQAVWDGWYDDDFFAEPVSAVIAQVCKRLDVAVDWARWEDEDWAAEEAEEGVEGSPFVKRAAPGEPNGAGKPPDGAWMAGACLGRRIVRRKIGGISIMSLVSHRRLTPARARRGCPLSFAGRIPASGAGS